MLIVFVAIITVLVPATVKLSLERQEIRGKAVEICGECAPSSSDCGEGFHCTQNECCVADAPPPPPPCECDYDQCRYGCENDAYCSCKSEPPPPPPCSKLGEFCDPFGCCDGLSCEDGVCSKILPSLHLHPHLHPHFHFYFAPAAPGIDV